MAAEVEEMKLAYEEKLREVEERAKTAVSRKASQEPGARSQEREGQGEGSGRGAGEEGEQGRSNGGVVEEPTVNQEQLKAMEK